MFHAAGEQVVGDGLAAFFMETGGQIGFGQMACGGDSIGEAWFCLGMDGGLEGVDESVVEQGQFPVGGASVQLLAVIEDRGDGVFFQVFVKDGGKQQKFCKNQFLHIRK